MISTTRQAVQTKKKIEFFLLHCTYCVAAACSRSGDGGRSKTTSTPIDILAIDLMTLQGNRCLCNIKVVFFFLNTTFSERKKKTKIKIFNKILNSTQLPESETVRKLLTCMTC